MADSVDDQLIKHLTRQLLLPKVTIFGVQNGTNYSLLRHDEIWSGRRRMSPLRIEFRVIPHHSLQPVFVTDGISWQVFSEEPRYEGLKKGIHVEKKSR